ncbi:MAG: hypothetical protein ACYTHN_24895, partial [Planctomycetota bacterium]
MNRLSHCAVGPILLAVALGWGEPTRAQAGEGKAPPLKKAMDLAKQALGEGDGEKRRALEDSLAALPCASARDARAFTAFVVKTIRENHPFPDRIEKPKVLSISYQGQKQKVFVHFPEAYSPKTPRPLLICLHGHGDTGETYWKLLKSERETRGYGVTKNWFVASPNALPRGLYGPGAPGQGWIYEVISHFHREYPVDPQRVYVCGFSMGGHATWNTATLRPDWFAGLIAVAGVPFHCEIPGEGKSAYPFLPNALNFAAYNIQGKADKIVEPVFALEFEKILRGLKHGSLRFHYHRHAHHFPSETFAKALRWLAGKKQERYPKRFRFV